MGEAAVKAARSLPIVEESPCDGCEHFAACRERWLVCSLFEQWQKTGSMKKGDRNPSAARYDRMFFGLR